jgi:hypothetical protein
MPDSTILQDTKKVLGIDPDDESFDVDILMHVSTEVSTLTQLGVGPSDLLVDETTTWAQFIGTTSRYVSAKSYIYLKARIVFDPPASSWVLDAWKAHASELEWRLNILAESDPAKEVTTT